MPEEEGVSERVWERKGAVCEEVGCHSCARPVAVFCMVYHYTKRATLTRLLGNVGPAIYVVLLNKYFVILPVLIQ